MIGEIRVGYRGALRAQYNNYSTALASSYMTPAELKPKYSTDYFVQQEVKYKLGCVGCGAAKWKYDGSCRYCGRER